MKASIKNILGSLLIQASLRLSRFIVIVVAAALLTPPAFATFVLTLAMTDLVRGGLQAFDVGAVRLLAAGQDSTDVIQSGLEAKCLAGSIGLALLAAIAWAVYGADTAWLVGVSGLGTLAASFGSSFLVQRQADLALHVISLRVAIASAVGTAVAIAAVWATRSAVWSVLGTAVGDALLLAALYARHAWRAPALGPGLAVIRKSQQLLVMQLAYIGQFRAGTIVLAAAATPIAVGEYSIASRFAEGLIIIAVALSASSLPMIGAAHARNEPGVLASIFEKSYGAGLRLTAPVIGALALSAPLWNDVLFPQYPGLGPVFAVAGYGVIIYFASSQTTALLNATHRDEAASLSAVAGMLTSIAGLFILTPFGALGAAWARVAGEAVRLIIEATTAVRDLGVHVSALARPWLAISPVLIGIAIAMGGGWTSPSIWIAVAAVLLGSSGVSLLLRRSTHE